MAYIWSYLRRYPKWLAMNFTAAILFVIANLGLPTVLARMIDDGSSVFLILTTSPSLAWIVAISLPFLAVVVWYVAVKTRPLSEKQQATLDKINQYARENLDWTSCHSSFR